MKNMNKNAMNNLSEKTSNTDETITISRAEYEEIKAENIKLQDRITELERINEWFSEQIKLSNKAKFGSSSDKVSDEEYDQLSLLFDEAEATDWAEKVAEKLEVSVAPYVRKQKKSGLKDIVPENIPVEIEEHRLS